MSYLLRCSFPTIQRCCLHHHELHITLKCYNSEDGNLNSSNPNFSPPTWGASLLSGWGWPNPPVALQSPELRWVVGPILAPEPDQNQPFTLGGCRSGRLHPLKLHLRPDVQMYRTLPVIDTRESFRPYLSKNFKHRGTSLVLPNDFHSI